MDTHELQKAIGGVVGRDIPTLQGQASLRSLGISTSVSLLRLRASLERMSGRKLGPLHETLTVSELSKKVGLSLGGSEGSIPEEAVNQSPNPTSASEQADAGDVGFRVQELHIGIDIEEIGNLPETESPRDHDFYSANFTPSEIAYAILKENPRLHLCGFFCAKEALKKSAPELLSLRTEEIQVLHDSAGRPLVTTVRAELNRRYQFKVSISHAANYAVATVLAVRI